MPPITLDIRTMSLITTSIGFLFAIGLFIFGHRQKKFNGFPQLAAACASFGTGIFLLALRDFLPAFITVLVANTIITLGIVLYFEGIRRFLGVADKISPISVVAILLQIGLVYYYNYQIASINNRIITISIISAFISALCARELFRDRSDHWKVAKMMNTVVFIGYSLFQIYRVYHTLGESSIESFMNAGNVHGLAFLAIIFLIAGSSFGFVWMVSNRLEFELTELANHDQLTQILNRRGVETLSRQEFSKMNRVESDLAIIMTDIDHFKSVNDRFGHSIGDEVLVGFAQIISQNLRPFDIFGRIGGEEFVIILPNTTLNQAHILAERLRILVENFIFRINGNEIQITASFGITDYIPETDTLEKLIPFADKALYLSKQQGRNKVSHISQKLVDNS